MENETEGSERVCPTVEKAFELLGRKWAGLIIHVLAGGDKYFCELERAIPSLSARMLTARVKDLEENGLVVRTVSAGAPVRVTYSLTDKGKGLVPIMTAVAEWAHTWGDGAGPNPG
jgi:DNA-binding HxlR family transcriptional regulator